jgi:hypothetical protein
MPILSNRENEQQTNGKERNTGVTKERKEKEVGKFYFYVFLFFSNKNL